jgi:hypothetical protein
MNEDLPERPVPLPDLAERIRASSPHWEALARK